VIADGVNIMEAIDATRASTRHQQAAPRSRYLWFRKSKSETDKESMQHQQQRHGAAMASGHAVVSTSTSTSSTGTYSGVLRRLTADTVSSSSSHDVATNTSSVPLPVLKHAAVQCSLVTGGHCAAVTSDDGCDVTASTLERPDENADGGMCAGMAAAYRGASHQRRKAISISATGDENLLAQHTVSYR